MKESLRICIEAAKQRREALDHTIFYGPPGLGKTTIAHIIAREMGGALRSTSGLVLAHAGDLAAILTNLQEHDVLFIDEIHRLPASVEEALYPAMEDFQLDLVDRPGTCSQNGQIGTAPIYAGGGHDQGRRADLAAPGPIRPRPSAGVLFAGGAAEPS